MLVGFQSTLRYGAHVIALPVLALPQHVATSLREVPQRRPALYECNITRGVNMLLSSFLPSSIEKKGYEPLTRTTAKKIPGFGFSSVSSIEYRTYGETYAHYFGIVHQIIQIQNAYGKSATRYPLRHQQFRRVR